MLVRRFPIVAAFLISALAACSDGGLQNDFAAGDSMFGDDFESIDGAPEPVDGAIGSPEDGGIQEGTVRLRVVQGVLNLRTSYLCHAPDFRIEDGDAGLAQATELPLDLPEGGFLPVTVTTYADVPSMNSGAITLHRAPNFDAGAPDAAVVDAGTSDAALAESDGAASDAGALLPPRCDHASLEAVLPLPMPPEWLDPALIDMDAGVADGGRAAEAGPSPAARGFVSTAGGGDTLTLFGSGLLMDESELERRVNAEWERALEAHSGDEALALEAANRHRRLLEATYGPRFLLSRAQPAQHDDSFALHFSHLIPDVPGTRADSGSGGLHLCVTVGTMEGSEIADAGAAGFDFRNYVALSDNLDPTLSYRFRVFVQSSYAAEQRSCASTSLKPVAELMVEAGSFEAGGSYSLVAWGALAPEAICTTYTQGSLIRPGCAQGADMLRPRLEIIDNR